MHILGLFKLTNKYLKHYITVNMTMHFCWAKSHNFLVRVYHCYPQNKELWAPRCVIFPSSLHCHIKQR